MCKFAWISLLSLMFSSSIAAIDVNNIPCFHADAVHQIRFCISRSSSDGALKSSLLEFLKTAFALRTFVETGTYLGETTLKAAHIFEEVHTIELSRELFLDAQSKFKEWKHVTVHYGDSGEMLELLLQTIPSRALFYLDGHYSSGSTAKGSKNTPILEELAAIRNSKKSDSVILIDDIRFFQPSLYPEKMDNSLKDYPDLSELVQCILQINPHYQICFLGDALLAFPECSTVTVSSVMSACALHRLASMCPDLTQEDLQHADLTIARAEMDEQKEIKTYYRHYAPYELEYGYRSFAAFWYGLILKEHGQERQALSLFQKASQNSIPYWRVEHFLK